MKKRILISSVLLVFLSYLLFTLVSIKSDNPLCTECPPRDSSCVISCGQALLDQSEPSTQYGTICFNYTLEADVDVFINMTIYGSLRQLQVNWTSGGLPPTTCTDPELCCVAQKCPSDTTRPRGDYYFLINKTQAIAGKYNISLSCGHYCGNGQIDNWFGEECDYQYDLLKNPNPDYPCKPYQFCNNACDCQNVTTGGCDYYDYCDLGQKPNNPSVSCCKDKNTGLDTNCCTIADCSIINPNAIAKSEYCYNKDYDITYVCVDTYFANHTVRQECGEVT